MEDFADRDIIAWNRSHNLLVMPIVIAIVTAIDAPPVRDEPTLNQLVPSIGLVADLLLGACCFEERRVGEPPDRALLILV